MPRYRTHFTYPTLNFTAEEELDSLVEEVFAEEGWDMVVDVYRRSGRPPTSQAEIDDAQREYDRLARECTEATRRNQEAVDAQQRAIIINPTAYGEEAVRLLNQRVQDTAQVRSSVCAARDAARRRLEELSLRPPSPSPAPPGRRRRRWWPF